jgi:hypothetical protein
VIGLSHKVGSQTNAVILIHSHNVGENSTVLLPHITDVTQFVAGKILDNTASVALAHAASTPLLL